MDTLNINSLLLKFISNNKLSFFFYLLFTMFEYPLIYIYIPEYYGKVINSFKDKSSRRSSTDTSKYLPFYITRTRSSTFGSPKNWSSFRS